MCDALIGTGFIGSLLRTQRAFETVCDSQNIGRMDNCRFGTVYCAAPSGLKWKANANPEEDNDAVIGLIYHLRQIEAECFVLISTVDVFGTPCGVNEETIPVPMGAYGNNRRHLEMFVEHLFKRSLVVRLPGIVGAGAKKGPLFDLRYGNEIEKLSRESTHQWYPGDRLLSDCEALLARGISLAHLTTPPVSIGELCEKFCEKFLEKLGGVAAVKYDVQTVYGNCKYAGPTPWDDIEEYLLPQFYSDRKLCRMQQIGREKK